MKVCIVGASGKLGQYMVQHALDRGYEVVGVCRERSVGKLERFKGRITVIPGATNDREVIQRAVAGCDGVLTVLVPWGVHQYSTGTAQAVLAYARPEARLVFSCGWHITRDGRDVYSQTFQRIVKAVGWLGRLTRMVDIDDQVEACRRIFVSDTRWTVVRGSNLEEGESQGLPVWSRHVGDPILKSNITRRVDFALFMVEALENDELVHEAPAIVGCRTPSALAHAGYGWLRPEGVRRELERMAAAWNGPRPLGDIGSPIDAFEAEPKRIALHSLAGRLDDVLKDIDEHDSVWRVEVGSGAPDFILGPVAVCGRVMGLYDAEYGWPHPVHLDGPWRIDDLVPGWRKHPVLMRGNREIAVAIRPDELRDIMKQDRH